MHVYTVIPNQSLPVEKITVRATKAYYCVLLFIPTPLLPLLEIKNPQVSTEGWLFVLLMVLILAVFALRLVLAFGRTLEFSKEGVTVSFGKLRRFYGWSELNMRVEDYTNAYGLSYKWFRPPKKGMVFSKGKIRKPIWLHSADYNSLHQPFAFFYVNFSLHKTGRWYDQPLDHYMVEESVFMSALQQWGINVDMQP